MTNRSQEVYVQVSLWVHDNPDPPLDKEGRLLREYVADFTASGFTVEEIAEARKVYRRDYKYPRRSFSFLWDLCKQIRDRRLSVLSALEAWPLLWTVNRAKRNERGWSNTVPDKEITLEMVMESWPQKSRATAERLLKVIHTMGFGYLDTGNEAADRARFVQIYDTIDNRITDAETWATPDNLLPESKAKVARLVETVAENFSKGLSEIPLKEE